MSELVGTFAEGFLSRFGKDCGSRLFEVASAIGLSVREVDSDTFDGALLRIKGCAAGMVVIRKSIREPGRKLFTLAHELGHYLLPNQQDLMRPCQSGVIERWEGLPPAEIEANQFAAEILMPAGLITDLLRGEPSVEVIQKIAERFGASLTAAAYRMVELSSYRVAMVVSVDRAAVWYRASGEFGRAVRLGALDERTSAYECFHGSAPPKSLQPIAADAWLYEFNLCPDATVWEQSVAQPAYNSVLSVLYLKDPVELHTDYDEEEKEPLDPNEFTLRRRRWSH